MSVWLRAQLGKESVSVVARRAGLSRHQAARILSGHSEPRLHQFFALLEATTGRLSEFVAECVNIEEIPSLRDVHRRRELSRQLAFHEPWSSALLAAAECLSSVPVAEAEARLATTFNLPAQEIARYLSMLLEARLLSIQDGRLSPGDSMWVDTGTKTDAARRLTEHWDGVGMERAVNPGPTDAFSYNVFSVSRADLAQITRMQHEHFQRLRATIAKSRPETLAVLNMQLVEFDVDPR